MIARKWNGIVLSKPANQTTTCIVKVSSLEKHPKYGKYCKVVRKYTVHDELDCPVGTEVVVEEVPKISKTKSKKIVRRID